jgi:hypothetical protein
MESDLETSDQGLQFGTTEKFAMESTMRMIDACTNLDELKGLTKNLYSAWMVSKTMLKHEMFKALPPPLSEYLEAKQIDFDSLA